MSKPFICQEHNFITTSPKAALKHTQGDVIDVVLRFTGDMMKAKLGIPLNTPQGVECRCFAAPFPHTHAQF